MGTKGASRCEAAGEKGHRSSCRCFNRQRTVWGTHSVLQPKAESVGRVLTRRAGFSPFPVDPEGERSSFREAESNRKSSTLSMLEHGPRKVGWRVKDRLRGIFAMSSSGFLILVEVTLGLGGGNDH